MRASLCFFLHDTFYPQCSLGVYYRIFILSRVDSAPSTSQEDLEGKSRVSFHLILETVLVLSTQWFLCDWSAPHSYPLVGSSPYVLIFGSLFFLLNTLGILTHADGSFDSITICMVEHCTEDVNTQST